MPGGYDNEKYEPGPADLEAEAAKAAQNAPIPPHQSVEEAAIEAIKKIEQDAHDAAAHDAAVAATAAATGTSS